MSTEYIIDEDDIIALILNGQKFNVEDDGDNSVIIPKRFLTDFPVKELKKGIRITVCYDLQHGIKILEDSTEYSFERVDESNNLKIHVCVGAPFGTWDDDESGKEYILAKKAVVEERSIEVGDISEIEYNEYDEVIYLNYVLSFSAENLVTALNYAKQIETELEGAIQLSKSDEINKLSDVDNEAKFTLGVLIPLIRKLGFFDVRYNHGKKEYGKDIIFVRKTEFDELEYWGVQVKYGDVSGKVRGAIDEIIGQAADAFKMPFYDVYSKGRKKISKLVVAISGHFSENAIEKICEGVENSALQNNLVFIDGEKIKSLSERFHR